MKKHVPGLIFFAAIVAGFAVVYGLFRVYPLPEIEPVDGPVIKNQKTACFPRSADARIKVRQAIATPSERSLVVDISLEGFEDERPAIQAIFAFYTVGAEDVRLFRSEVVDVVPAVRRDADAHGIVRYRFDWLKDVRPSDNLYVTVRPVLAETDHLRKLSFSREDATAVLFAKK